MAQPNEGIRALCSRIRLFEGLDAAGLDEAAEAAEMREFPRRATLFSQGELPARLFALASGLAKISQINGAGDPVTLRVIAPGEVLACVAVFRQIPYPATAITMAESRVLSWPARTILEMMDRLPALRANALDIVGERTEDLAHQLTEMATARMDERVARALLRLAAQAGQATPKGVEISVPLSRQDLAEIAGTDLFSVSRLFRSWAARGIILARRMHVTILDPAALRALVGGSRGG